LWSRKKKKRVKKSKALTRRRGKKARILETRFVENAGRRKQNATSWTSEGLGGGGRERAGGKRWEYQRGCRFVTCMREKKNETQAKKSGEGKGFINTHIGKGVTRKNGVPVNEREGRKKGFSSQGAKEISSKAGVKKSKVLKKRKRNVQKKQIACEK